LKAGSDIFRSVPHRDDNGDIWIIRDGWDTFLLKETLSSETIEKDLRLLRIDMRYQGYDLVKSDKVPFHMRFK
jgi:hypothetical protein